jgi:hypothetical protein
MTRPRGTAGNGAVTLIDRLGPGEAPAGAVHAARSRSERSDVRSMWQTPEPARSGPSQGDQVTGRSGGAGAIQGGAAPPLRIPGAYAHNPSNPHRCRKSRGLEEQLGGGNLPWYGASILLIAPDIHLAP